MQKYLLAFLLFMLATDAVAENMPPACHKPGPRAALEGSEKACEGQVGNPSLVGEYRCELPDKTWATIYFWKCVSQPQLKK